MTYIGLSIPRIDAPGKVKGETFYPGDFNYPDQAYMKVLFADRPHAIIRSIDTSKAENLPGVLAIYTSNDVPNNEYGLIMNDQPVLCGPGSSKLYGDHVRFIGDQVALIIAETEEIASEARKFINVVYEDLPVVTDPRSAMDKQAALIHPDRGSNIFAHYRIRKGDIEEAFKHCEVIIEENYQTPPQEHAFLQPEAGVGFIDSEGRVTVVVAGQWAHEDQEQIAHALGLPLDKIRVIYPAIGGAFGGREDMSVQIILALAVWNLHLKGINRPIKIIWSREESMIGHHKRHPFFIHTRWGANKEGKILAAEVEMIADGGSYAYTSTKVLGNATLLCTGAYDIPNVKVDSYAVYTNNIPNGAFRGFGGPQAIFSAENQVNKLAQALKIDPVEFRMRNVLREGSELSVGTPLPKGVSLPEVVAACAEKSGWEKSENGWRSLSRNHGSACLDSTVLARGIGFACGYKNVGFSFGAPEQCTTTIELHGDEKIEKAVVYHAGADVGQGAHTVFTQMAAAALDISIDKIHMVVSDTAVTGNSGSASASRMTFMAGNSIKGAAELALQKWQNEERPVKVTYQYRPPKTTPLDPEMGKSEPNFAYGYVAESAEVEVDTETGQIRIIKIVCVDDVGKAVNPVQIQGQVEGAIVQAAGYTILENFIEKNAEVLTRTFSTYLIPTILDIPDEVETILLEYPDPIGPWGARGMAEMPYLPFAPAITAAVHDAIGIWFNDFPLTPEKVLKGLGKLG
jgi:CO/xanthine dehydrogenase Mo-binding subunit